MLDFCALILGFLILSKMSENIERFDIPPEVLELIERRAYAFKSKNRYFFRDVDIQDLVQSGVIACLKAMERFDPSRGKIQTFLMQHINRAIQQEAWRAVVGDGNAPYAASVSKSKQDLEEAGDSDPDFPNIERISEKSKVSQIRVKQILAAMDFKRSSVVLQDDKDSIDRYSSLIGVNEDFIEQESKTEKFKKNNTSKYFEGEKDETRVCGEDYILVFPNLLFLLKKKNSEYKIVISTQKYNFLSKLSESDFPYSKRSALRKLSSTKTGELLALPESLLESPESDTLVYKNRKNWKKCEGSL